MNPSDSGRAGQPGSSPDNETRQEIIRAAHRLLWQRPFREITIAALMDATSVGRSSFYIHFQDRYDLATALLEEVDHEISAATPTIRPDVQLTKQLRANLVHAVAVWERHGPIIRGIAEASSQDDRLDELYRFWFIQRSIERTHQVVLAAQRDGRLPASTDPREFSTLMTLMATAYMNDRLGRVPQAPRDTVAGVLVASFGSLLNVPLD